MVKQNVAFHGHNEGHDSANKGNFLQLVQLLSEYDIVLKEHILYLEHSKSPKVSYISPDI